MEVIQIFQGAEMKKVIFLLICAVFSFSFFACDMIAEKWNEFIGDNFDRPLKDSQGLLYEFDDEAQGFVVTGISKSAAHIVIPDTYKDYPVVAIGGRAFDSCSSLTSVTIGDSVTSIGDYAFWNCFLLTSVTIGDGVNSIGDGSFCRCSSLVSVTIPNSVTSIGSHAFRECSALTSVTIPDSVTTIGSFAFHVCSSLTSVTIGDSVTSIGYRAFYDCDSLTSVIFEDPTGWWYASSADATSGTAISESSLADASTAAYYLRSDYYRYYWFKD